MRIAQVIHAFPPYSVGGSENYTLALCKEFQRRGHEVAIFHRIADFSKEEYAVEQGEVDGLPVWRMNHIFRYHDCFEKLYRDDEIDKRFAAFLDTFQPQVVHLHHLTCLSTSSVFEVKARGCPLVMTLHDYWLICQRGQFLKTDLTLCPGQDDHACVKCLTRELSVGEASRKLASTYRRVMPHSTSLFNRVDAILRKLYLRGSRLVIPRQDSAVQKVRQRMEHMREVCEQIDLFVAPSRFLADRFRSFGVPASKLLYSDNGYDVAAFSNRAERVRKERERLRFGFIGVVFPPKGVHVLLEAFREILEDEAELVIHGSLVPYEGFEGYEEQLQRLAAGRSNIHFAGPYVASEVDQILGALDVLVVPSVWYENSPLTIHEAFLAHVPVITADLGGMRELVHDGVNGLLFRPRDAADLRTKIRQLIGQPQLLEQLSGRAPVVKTITEDAADMEQRYRHLCAIVGPEEDNNPFSLK
jgi:glycosyltransferase involved in cell wall biosynthesis